VTATKYRDFAIGWSADLRVNVISVRTHGERDAVGMTRIADILVNSGLKIGVWGSRCCRDALRLI
jgi:hypothetical protein